MTSTVPIPKYNEVIAELCKRSLYIFVKEFWNTIIKDKFEDNWHIEYLCDEIQLVYDKHVFNRSPHISNEKWYNGIIDDIQINLIVNIPPGTSKSTIASRMAPAWMWAIDDTKTLISNTVSSSNATEFAQASVDIINSEKYKAYFPQVEIRYGVSAKTFYQSKNGGVRYSFTTKAGGTGKHAHIISDDDSMDYKMATSPAEAKLGRAGFRALQTRKKDKRKTPYIGISQKLSNLDNSTNALKVYNGFVKHICLPAENIYKNIQPPELEKYYVDGLLDPKRLNREVLHQQKMGLTEDSKPISDIDYNIQFNQATETGESLLYSKLNFVPDLPSNRDGVIRFSFTDVADTGADYFATIFCEINQSKIYVYDIIYTQEPSNNTSGKIKAKVEMHGSMINKIETNNQGSVFVTLMQQMGVYVDGYYSSGNKQQRISAWAQFSSFVYFLTPMSKPYHTNEYNQAIKHIQAYPKTGTADDGHDDIEDAFTEMLRYFYTNYRSLFTMIN